MSTALITLDSRGIVEDPDQKIERILSYLLTTEASQSNIHRGQLISIPDTMRKYGHDIVSMKTEMENLLENCFRGYFDNIMVDVTIKPSDQEDGRLNVVIQAKVEQDGRWHDVAKALSATNQTIQLVSEFNVQ